MTTNADIDIIDAAPSPITLSTGLSLNVERLKTRQMLRLMKILTRGAGDALAGLRTREGEGAEEWAAQALVAIVFAIPEAEEETIDFVRSMVTPAGLIEDPRSKPEQEVNASLWERFDEDLANPDIDDLVSIIERVVNVEAPHLMALGKRLALLVKTQQSLHASKQPSASAATSKPSTRKRSSAA